jgi:creatinine amidohydrolase/Fe(II)-dependent formamide hydrolase-like protein
MRTFALRLAALLLLGASMIAHAEAPATVFLDELTSPELGAQIRGGKSTVIVPVGGTEQSGPHMALGKHNVRVKALAAKIATALGNAIVAPVIAYVPEGAVNPPTGHMRYPGTITVPADAYRKILDSAARSFRLAGFRDIILLGDHGDYQKDNESVAQQLNREWAASNVRVHAVREYYRVPTAWFAEALRSRGYSDAEIGIHAGLADTSLMLALDPHMVRSDLMQPLPGQKGMPGVNGDPRRSSAELGKIAVDAIVAQTVAAIRAAVASH